MDLRRLRDHPDLELAQFKKQLKSFTVPRYVVIVFGIILAALITFTVFGLYKLSKPKIEGRQLYKTTETDDHKDTTQKEKLVPGSPKIIKDSERV